MVLRKLNDRSGTIPHHNSIMVHQNIDQINLLDTIRHSVRQTTGKVDNISFTDLFCGRFFGIIEIIDKINFVL